MEKEAKRLFIIFWVVIILETVLLSVLFFQRVLEGKEKVSLKLELKQASTALSEKDTEIQDLRSRLTALEDIRRSLETKMQELLSQQKLAEGEAKGTKDATNILAQQFQRQSDEFLNKLSEISDESRRSSLSLVTKIEDLLDTKHKLELELASLSRGSGSNPKRTPQYEQQGVSLGKILVEQKPSYANAAPSADASQEGKILSIDAQYNFVIIDLGSQHGVKQKDRFFVIRRNGWIGEIEIEEVYKNMSLANVVTEKTMKALRKNDKVVPAQ